MNKEYSPFISILKDDFNASNMQKFQVSVSLVKVDLIKSRQVHSELLQSHTLDINEKNKLTERG